ncbi:type II toxin-antitoxin system PemK/MazF family toxin [uncultured Chitinophaga sp.]|uniref:type II toxin-antitoxin system PemK/MazF family toxin n=1 Tax=uncultured Chitinophaga sp. TaxID=339340 RepID=UPI0025E3AC1D|nr:type II toxin-antitoxin system PemK/MazF family toxin [uncultured Chitinophaga sp.]
MKVSQRDVFLLPHPLGNENGEPHPHIVLSTNDANHCEETFIAVMFTSSTFTVDEYSFKLDNSMFEKPLQKEYSHVRIHLVCLAVNEAILSHKLNRMKAGAFDNLMKEIGEMLFEFEFQRLRHHP